MSWSDEAAELDLWQSVHRVCTASSGELAVMFGRVPTDDLERVARALEEAMRGSSDEEAADDDDDAPGGTYQFGTGKFGSCGAPTDDAEPDTRDTTTASSSTSQVPPSRCR